MFLYWNILTLLLLRSALSRPLSSLTTPSRGCPTCKGKSTQSQPTGNSNTTTLAAGEPCGVYTLSCAHGLQCTPPENDSRPLRALLEGRGVCNNISDINTTVSTHSVDTAPTEDPDEAPCRELLTTLMTGLTSHVFKSHHDIYMPNCDKDGFFRKKQCWSSRGKQRGKCWCVDENGIPVTSATTRDGTLIC
ncbi:insulin-like growth factor-binding protein 5 [Sphaeramia orbicularis]|uniref:insulin-like growth factor-binding protein 5 n=1 Tax=Sphaeramia orbicularis TaxID=375764 RepID=UPI00117C916F|nr:insulin-like growth factor-binding protein 5 [Sphaeramia orbicularis]